MDIIEIKNMIDDWDLNKGNILRNIQINVADVIILESSFDKIEVDATYIEFILMGIYTDKIPFKVIERYEYNSKTRTLIFYITSIEA